MCFLRWSTIRSFSRNKPLPASRPQLRFRCRGRDVDHLFAFVSWPLQLLGRIHTIWFDKLLSPRVFPVTPCDSNFTTRIFHIGAACEEIYYTSWDIHSYVHISVYSSYFLLSPPFTTFGYYWVLYLAVCTFLRLCRFFLIVWDRVANICHLQHCRRKGTYVRIYPSQLRSPSLRVQKLFSAESHHMISV